MRIVLVVFLILIGSSLTAQSDKPSNITFYGSFLHTKIVPDALFFFNDVEAYDSFELRRALRNHDINIIVLASNGGNVWEGLSMAGLIHDQDIMTYVPKLPSGKGCFSACSYMFFGGKTRRADGILGVHQAGAYGTDRDRSKEQVSKTQQSTQFTVSEIIGFLNEFDTPPWVYEKMFRSRDMYEFDESEKALLALGKGAISARKIHEINKFVDAYFRNSGGVELVNKKPETVPQTELTEDDKIILLVKEIQTLLNAAGCEAGPTDGVWGQKTRNAAVRFAKLAELPTAKGKLLSEQFLIKLREASPNFCVRTKPSKPGPVEQQELSGSFSIRTDCFGGKDISWVSKFRYRGQRISDIHVFESNITKGAELVGDIHIERYKTYERFDLEVDLKISGERYYRRMFMKTGGAVSFENYTPKSCTFTMQKIR